MFSRLFRLSDRVGRLLVKISVWLGDHFIGAFRSLFDWSRKGGDGDPLDTHSARAETQVRSLSGLTVILLAAVVTLIFLATSSQAQGNSGIQFISFATAAPENVQPTQGAESSNPIVQVPEIHSTGTIVFTIMTGNQDDLFALSAGQTTPTRLTDHAADDRYPAWSPDGQKLAFSSRRDGNWELYILEMVSGQITRLTFDPVYEANPTWSPDGLWIAYEAYYQGNLDIWLIKADASEGPYPVTDQPGADFSPAWTTNEAAGRNIAYVSERNGTQDIYLLSLDRPSEEQATNLTNTPNVPEDSPRWSPDGSQIAYAVTSSGLTAIYVTPVAQNASPVLIGQGHSPAWSPDGREIAYLSDQPEGASPTVSWLITDQSSAIDVRQAFGLPAMASQTDWTAATLPAPQGTLAFAATAPLPTPFAEPVTPPQPGSSYFLKPLPGVVSDADAAYLNDRVDGSFMILRDQINQAAGWDVLGRLDSAWWTLDQRPEPGQSIQSWHKAGRAVDIIQDYNKGNPAQIELVPEQIGTQTYWRLYVRAATQDGSLGEPLRTIPWDFDARFSGDVDAYEAGGKLKAQIPSGYYVDFTRLALAYGWSRTPSDSTWRYNWPGVLYWQYEKREGLDWWTAMLEMYTQDVLENEFFTPTPGPTQPRPILPTATETPRGTTPPRTITPVPTPTPQEEQPSDG